MSLIQVRDLCYAYGGGGDVLDGLSLNVEAGEVVGEHRWDEKASPQRGVP